MDWIKVLTHGAKAFAFVLIGAIVAVILGALTTALGYQPEGILNQTVWTYIVYPLLVGLIAAISNWWQHRN